MKRTNSGPFGLCLNIGYTLHEAISDNHEPTELGVRYLWHIKTGDLAVPPSFDTSMISNGYLWCIIFSRHGSHVMSQSGYHRSG